MKNQTHSKPKKSSVACLSCGESIHIGSNTKVGSTVVCQVCEAELLIVNLNPFKVEWPEFDDDYGDFEDDEPIYEDLDDFDVGDESYDYDDEDDLYDYDEEE